MGGDQAFALLERILADPGALLGRTAVAVPDENPEADLRGAALWALGNIGSEPARALIESTLADPDTHVRGCAVGALSRAGGAKVVALLEQALADPAASVRRAAVSALGKAGGAKAMALLERTLADPDVGVRGNALAVLVSLTTAPAALKRALADPAPGMRWDMAAQLGLPLAEGTLPKLGAVTLDGDLAEWGAAAAVPLRYAAYIAHRLEQHAWNGPADCGLEVLCGWNEQGLCLAGVVADDDVRNDAAPATSYEQDCVELCLDGRGGQQFMQPPVTKGAYQLFVRPPVGGQPVALAFNTDYGGMAGAPVAGKLVPGGWTFELVIPWTAFPEFTPQVGSALGLQFGVDDYDTRDGNDVQPLLLTWQATTDLFSSPQKLIRWTLADALPYGPAVDQNLATGSALPDVADPAYPVKGKLELGRTLAARAVQGAWEIRTPAGATAATGRLTLAPLEPPWQESRGAAFAWTPGDVPDGLYFLEATFTDAAGKSLGQAQRGFVLARPPDRQALRLPGLRTAIKLATPGIVALAFAAKQQQVLTAGAGGVQRYDSQTGKLLATLTDQECAAVCVTPTIIAFAHGNDIRLVAANDGAARGALKGHTKSVRAVAATADGQRLASVALDNTLRLWDVAQQKQLRELKLDATPRCVALALALAPDGQLVAVGTVAGNIHLFAVATGKQVAVLTGHTYSVRTLAFAPDGRQLLSGSDDLKAVLWEVPSGQRLRTLTGHSSLVTGVAFTADGKQAVTGAQDGSVRLWDVATGKALRRLVDGQAGFAALALSGATVIVGGQGADVLVLDLAP